MSRCKQCDSEFIAFSESNKFCSRSCYETYTREKNNPNCMSGIKQTGRDKINAMSNEQLADLLCMGEHCPSNIGLNEIGCNEASDVAGVSCKQCWLNVLESETE